MSGSIRTTVFLLFSVLIVAIPWYYYCRLIPTRRVRNANGNAKPYHQGNYVVCKCSGSRRPILFWFQRCNHPYKGRQRVSIHLVHDMGTVDFDGSGADPQRFRDTLVRQAFQPTTASRPAPAACRNRPGPGVPAVRANAAGLTGSRRWRHGLFPAIRPPGTAWSGSR